MKKARKEDISLHHYVRNEVLKDFIEIEKHVPLVYLEELSRESGTAVYQAESNMLPKPNSYGRGWVYVDSFEYFTEQTDSVVVYDGLGTVISGGYDIDYVDCRIIMPNTTVVPATVTYKWYYVAVVDEWDDVHASDVPVVVVDLTSFTKEGFQLGGGKFIPRRVNIHVFATNQAEREDLNEAIYDGLYLKSCPMQELPFGTMIDWDGRWNDSYVFATISGSSWLKFENVKARNVYPRLISTPTRDYAQLSDLNRYRSRITFDMFHWEEA